MMFQGTITNRKKFLNNGFGKRAYWLLLEVETKSGKVEELNTTHNKIPTVGDYVIAHGKYNRTKYGNQFKANKCTFLDPQEPEYIMNRIKDDFELSAPVKKYVSSSKFQKLINKLKKDIWSAITSGEITLKDDEKVSEEVIKELQREYAKFKNEVSDVDKNIAEIIDLFAGHEIVLDEKIAKKIAIALGPNVLKHVVDDITNLCGLLDIDVILEFGKKIKVGKELRVQAKYLSELFENCRDKRHLCLRKTKNDDSESDSEDENKEKETVDALVAKKRIIRYDEFLYPVPPEYGAMYADDDSVDDEDDDEMIPLLPKLGNYDLDHIVALTVAQMVTEKASKVKKDVVDEIIETIVDKEGLCKEQQEALVLFAKTNLLIVTGQPGTGKTRLIRGLARFCKMTSVSFHIMSPTGCATRRIRDVLADLSSLSPSTVHSYVYSRDKVPYDCLIIDEASMIDSVLMYDLMTSKLYKKIVFIGDINQLAPPGLGQCFKEMMKVDRIPKVILTQTFRFDENTKGIKIALERILKGNTKIEEIGDGIEVYTKKSKIFSIAKKFKKYDPDKLRIMSSTNKTVNELLPELREIFNPDAEVDDENFTFCPNDVVMQTKNSKIEIGNDITVNVYNGDFLTVIEETMIKEKEEIQIDGKTTKRTVTMKGYTMEHYGRELFIRRPRTMKLGYASTCHKAQGSEADTCIIYLPFPSQINTRNLLYTAVSRAKKRAVIIAPEEVLQACIKTKEAVRYSCLALMIENELDEKMKEKNRDLDEVEREVLALPPAEGSEDDVAEMESVSSLESAKIEEIEE